MHIYKWENEQMSDHLKGKNSALKKTHSYSNTNALITIKNVWETETLS